MSTLTSNDSITDASTTDSDTLTAELIANVDSTVTITNIENLSFNALSGTRIVDGTKMTGVKTIEHKGTGSLTLTNVQEASTAYKMTGTSSDLSVTVKAAALTGAADVAAVTLAGTTAGTLTVGGAVETVKLTSSGSAQNVLTNVVAASAATLSIDGGAGFKNTAAFGSNFTTIDARSAGAVDLQVTSAANLAVLAGGSDDKVSVTGALDASSLYALGAGTDTLVLKDSTGGAAATFTGVENIQATDSGATSINLTNADQAVNIDLASTGTGATAVTITNMKAGSTVKATKVVAGTSASAVGFADSATGTTLNLDLQKGVTAGNAAWTFTNVGELTVTAGAATDFANTVLDDNSTASVATTKFSVVNNSTGTVDVGAITASSKMTDLTVTSSAVGGTVLGTVAEAEALKNVTINATAGTVEVGAIGTNAGTAMVAMDTIVVNAGKEVTLADTAVEVANTAGISSIINPANK